jgi:hypothetical protein
MDMKVVDNNELFDINGAAELLEVEQGTVRQLMTKYELTVGAHAAFVAGLVPTDKVVSGLPSVWAASPKTGKPVRAFTLEALTEYSKHERTGGGRSGAPGSSKWMKVNATPAAFEAISKIDGVKEVKSAFNYDKQRSKEYRVKRDAKRRDAKAAKTQGKIPSAEAAKAFVDQV